MASFLPRDDEVTALRERSPRCSDLRCLRGRRQPRARVCVGVDQVLIRRLLSPWRRCAPWVDPRRHDAQNRGSTQTPTFRGKRMPLDHHHQA